MLVARGWVPTLEYASRHEQDVDLHAQSAETGAAAKITWRHAARRGVAAAVEHRDVPFGEGLATVLDIGSHRGQFALLARELYPLVRFVCFEPFPASVSELRGTLADDPLATIEPVALAAEVGTRDLHVSRRTDSSSLLPITPAQALAFPGTQEVGTTSVETTTLDHVFAATPPARPCLLKIDVQGGELDVLLGARETLRHVDVAYVECSFVEFYEGQPRVDDIVAILAEGGLRMVGVYSITMDAQNRCLQADFLFRRAFPQARSPTVRC